MAEKQLDEQAIFEVARKIDSPESRGRYLRQVCGENPALEQHEAYLRLVGNDNDRRWDNRGHFFAAAAEAMRRILINRARDKQRLKRGGGHLGRSIAPHDFKLGDRVECRTMSLQRRRAGAAST